ncbi:hypothetical protein P9597_23155, partial [Aneurinibacillus migulanus]|uniref:hypothetical protein n=1 Tax=Aneurinibacillus migulanus TaxID=47500 RepID=UPI002E1A8916|nr:hypothetical protein [Aneurinibacillus migulanus]
FRIVFGSKPISSAIAICVQPLLCNSRIIKNSPILTIVSPLRDVKVSKRLSVIFGEFENGVIRDFTTVTYTNAIRKQTEIEKSKTNDQNRFVVKYNLSQILTTLYKHSEEKGLESTERREIKESIEEIEKFPLALYFSEKEIEDILDLIKYLKSDFDNKFFTATAYGINPMNASEAEFAKLKEEIKQKNKKKMSIVNEAKERVRKALEVL